TGPGRRGPDVRAGAARGPRLDRAGGVRGGGVGGPGGPGRPPAGALGGQPAGQHGPVRGQPAGLRCAAGARARSGARGRLAGAAGRGWAGAFGAADRAVTARRLPVLPAQGARRAWVAAWVAAGGGGGSRCTRKKVWSPILATCGADARAGSARLRAAKWLAPGTTSWRSPGGRRQSLWVSKAMRTARSQAFRFFRRRPGFTRVGANCLRAVTTSQTESPQRPLSR